MELICQLTDLQGKASLWREISALEVKRSRETPADSLEIQGYFEGLPENYRQVRLLADGMELFHGRVDRQETGLSEKGSRLLLECRSAGAMMLDNEAPPKAYSSISGRELFREHLEPFHFTLAEALPDIRLSAYKVTAGMREWEVFAVFCRRAYGRTPYADKNRQVWLYPRGRKVGVSGEQVVSLTRSYYPYKTISHVYVRDTEGYYTTRVGNPHLQDPTLIRRRFIVPNPQYTGTKYGNAYEKMAASLRQTFQQEAVLSGAVEIEPGDTLALEHSLADREMTLVQEVSYQLDEQGLTTRVLTIRPEDSR